MPDSLVGMWRKAAMDGWCGAQDHVGQADTDPEPCVEAGADAAVRVVLEALAARADGCNLDDGLWYRRFQVLLKEMAEVRPLRRVDDSA